MPILPILGIIFITLKLCGVITWGWFYVLLPFTFVFFLLAVALARVVWLLFNALK